MLKHFSFISLFCFAISSKIAMAYPEFIGHGYTSCLACHYNGAGNGPINDYGRGVWASEIAARPFYNPNADENALSDSSGFLGSAKLPYWIRPSLKYRGLNVTSNPGSSTAKTKFYKMQSDLNLVISFDPDQKYIFSGSIGTLENENYAAPNLPLNKGSKDLLISREHYVRIQFGENLYTYFGFMDKVFGIRLPDHRAVNRAPLNLGQNNQVHGAVVQYHSEKYEFFINPFLGNTRLDANQVSQGISFLYEFEPFEKRRLGASFLTEKSEQVQHTIVALLAKYGIGDGNSFLLEGGIHDTKPSSGDSTKSAYALGLGTIRLTRGLNFQSMGQYSKANIEKIATENLSWGFGLVYFPIQRVELRALAETGRAMDPNQVQEDSWNFQTQMHLSL